MYFITHSRKFNNWSSNTESWWLLLLKKILKKAHFVIPQRCESYYQGTTAIWLIQWKAQSTTIICECLPYTAYIRNAFLPAWAIVQEPAVEQGS